MQLPSLGFAVPHTALAGALQWAIQQQGEPYIARYLDDFITIRPPNSDQCALNQEIIMAT